MRKFSYYWLLLLFYFINLGNASGQILWKVGNYTNGMGNLVNYTDYIPINSFQMAVEVPVNYSGGGAPILGRPQASPIEITKSIDVLSNYLVERLGRGTSINEIEIIWLESNGVHGPAVVHRVKLTDVLISSVKAASAGGCIGCEGSEACTLLFKKLERFTYRRDNDYTPVLMNRLVWDVENNSVTLY